jgi:alanine racemase
MPRPPRGPTCPARGLWHLSGIMSTRDASTDDVPPLDLPRPVGETPETSRAWLEVDLAALQHNARAIARLSGLPIIPMIKADAYGLGISPVVRALQPLRPAGWGVATVAEGVAARDAGAEGPIQVFSPVTVQDLARGLQAGLRMTVPCAEALEALPTGAEGEVEVEIDTGMGRAGLPWDGQDQWMQRLLVALGERPALRWTGIFTHLHSADDPEILVARASVDEQLTRFEGVLEAVHRASGGSDAVSAQPSPERALSRGRGPVHGGPGSAGFRIHVANSAAALRLGSRLRRFDAVRPGIGLYGGAMGAPMGLKPVASVRARVVRVARVEAGSTAGYAATYTAQGRETWGTLAIGYGDGLPRSLSNRGAALVHGERVPIVGRISMDMTVVDMSMIHERGEGEVRPGDVATLLGGEPFGGEVTAPSDDTGVAPPVITLEELARKAGTIDYEILTGWTGRLPRIYHGGEADS